MGRTVIVGDVHGCALELEALLDQVGFDTGDRLVLVGDCIARGPDSLGVLDIVRRTGAVLVRGNHEERILASPEASEHLPLWGRVGDGGGKSSKPLNRIHAEVAASLRPVDWSLLHASPLHFDLPEHGVRVVHAGVVPGVPIEAQKRSTLLGIRGLGDHGEPLDRRGGVPWGSRYQGPPHVVFGHNAGVHPQLHPWATGIDTGCVYGGALTGIVLAEGERVPRERWARRKLLVVVPARHEYYMPSGR
jgi:hypothetical protein